MTTARPHLFSIGLCSSFRSHLVGRPSIIWHSRFDINYFVPSCSFESVKFVTNVDLRYSTWPIHDKASAGGKVIFKTILRMNYNETEESTTSSTQRHIGKATSFQREVSSAEARRSDGGDSRHRLGNSRESRTFEGSFYNRVPSF